LAKPIALNASPKWPDVKDDYVVRYDGHLKEISPQRLERAWELGRAFVARRQRMGMAKTEAT